MSKLLATSVLFGQGNATVGLPVHYNVRSTNTSIAIGDLHGDGIVELAATDDIGSKVSLLLAVGNGTFV